MAPSREEESRLQVRTLIIASLASLAAALVTAEFWIAGTPIAAALTPVIVTIVSEMLNRPTEAIARRVTTDRPAILPQATGAGSPEERQDEEPPRVARDLEGERAPVRVYRPEPRKGWGRIHPKAVILTAALAFAIAAAALTLPELIAGESLGKGDRKTTLWGGRDRDEPDEPRQPEQTTPAETQPEETPPPEEEQQPTVTEEQPTTPTETAPLTVPTVPEQPPEVP